MVAAQHTRLVMSASWGHSAATGFAGLGTGALTSGLEGTETRVQTVYRSAGVLSLLHVRCTARTGSTVVTTRKAAGAGAQTVTLSSTGLFEDTTNTDTVTAADKWDISASALASTMSVIALTFAATTNTVCRLLAYVSGATGTGVNFNSASSTYFQTIAGQLQANIAAAESQAQSRVQKAGTLTNLMINIVTNTGTNGCTVTSRVGAGPGNLTTGVIATGVTGIVEDTTHTDSLVAGNDVDYSLATGASSVAVNATILGVDFTSTNGDGVIINANSINAGKTILTSVTDYLALAGPITFVSLTETDVQCRARDTFTMNNLTANVQSNTITANTVITFRKNAGSATNQTLTYGSNAFGVLSDTTNTDILAVTDDVNYQIVTGGTGTSIVLNLIEVWTNLGGAAATVANPAFFTTKLPDIRMLQPMFAKTPIMIST